MRISLSSLLVISTLSGLAWAEDKSDSPAAIEDGPTLLPIPPTATAKLIPRKPGLVARRSSTRVATSTPVSTKNSQSTSKGSDDILSWVKNLAGLGDTYIAANGVGVRVDKDIKRFSGSFVQIVQGLLANPVKMPNFEFLADADAKIEDIRKKQIKKLSDGSQNLVLLAAGANDALFPALFKACIYQPTTQGNCTKAISASKKAINKKLKAALVSTFEDLSKKVKDDGLVVVIPYPEPFNEKPKKCDLQTMTIFDGILSTKSTKFEWSINLRKKINGVVVDLNSLIKEAAKEAGGKPDIKLADVNTWTEQNSGRFCVEDKDAKPEDAALLFSSTDFGIPNEIDRRSISIESRDDKLTFHGNAILQNLFAAKIMETIAEFRTKNKREPVCSASEVTEATCLKRKLDVPQHKTDGTINLEDIIPKWCKMHKEANVHDKAGGFSTGGTKRIASRYGIGDHSVWLSVQVQDLPNCQKATVDEKDCEDQMKQAMAYCDPDSGISHGFVVTAPDNCLQYSVDLGEGQNDKSPPWSSLESEFCKAGATEFTVSKEDFVEARKAWCKDPTKAAPTTDKLKNSISFEFKADGKCDDLTKDCEDAVNRQWIRCSDNLNDKKKTSEPELDTKNGPIHGSGGTRGKCGDYTFKVKSNEYPSSVNEITPGILAIFAWHATIDSATYYVNWTMTNITEKMASDKGVMCTNLQRHVDYVLPNYDYPGLEGWDKDKFYPTDFRFDSADTFLTKGLNSYSVAGWPCTYEGDEKKPGTLKCAGYKDIPCKDVDKIDTTYCTTANGNYFYTFRHRMSCNIRKEDKSF